MTEEIELILVLGFGIVQRREMSKQSSSESVVEKVEQNKTKQSIGGGNIGRLKADLAQRMGAAGQLNQELPNEREGLMKQENKNDKEEEQENSQPVQLQNEDDRSFRF